MKNVSILKRIARYMLLCLSGLVICLNLVTFVLSECGLRSRLSWIPGAFYKVETGSMEPELYAGDLMFIWRTPFKELEVGDTVTVVTDGEYTTHRIVRLADDEIVTRGLVNELDDSPVGTDGYIGKKVFSLRGLGDVYEALISTWVCILCVALIVMLFLLGPVIRWLKKKTDGLVLSAERTLCGLLCVSLAILPPVSTLAKFTGIVSAGKTVAAAEINFTSNYLTPEVNSYDIIGWNGDNYYLNININNFGNALKYNADGVDIHYTIEIEKISSDETGTYTLDYTAVPSEEHPVGTTVNSSGGQDIDTGIYATDAPQDIVVNSVNVGTVLGSFPLNGGEKTYHTFSFRLNAMDAGNQLNLADGQKVKFRITARTSPEEGYSQVISAYFSMTVTTAKYFIDKSILEEKPGNAVVGYTAKSATLIGVPDKQVVIQWNPELLYINEYDTTFWNLCNNGQCEYSKTEGWMTFRMYATSSMRFELFKYTEKLNTQLTHRRITVDPDGHPGNSDDYELVQIYKDGDEPPAIPTVPNLNAGE